MSDGRLVMRGEREPAAAGCSGASEPGPVCTSCLAAGVWGGVFFPLPPPFWLLGFFFAQDLQRSLEHRLVAVLKVSCVEHCSPRAGCRCALLLAGTALAHPSNAKPPGRQRAQGRETEARSAA